jgi:hypothetical protein
MNRVLLLILAACLVILVGIGFLLYSWFGWVGLVVEIAIVFVCAALNRLVALIIHA